MLNKQKSKKARDAGIETAITNAESKHERWKEKALLAFKQYPESRFMTEQVREWAYRNGLAKAPSDRAWGSVATEARKLGIISHAGYQAVSNPNAHATPASLWERTI